MKTRLNDPARARDYFKAKMEFTTGPVELNHMIEHRNENINIVDVRAAEDYAQGHIPGAVNLPRTDWTTFRGLHRERLNILYCYTQQCHLAATAAVEFAAHGYPVMEMQGGFAAWKQSELPIETSVPLQKAA